MKNHKIKNLVAAAAIIPAFVYAQEVEAPQEAQEAPAVEESQSATENVATELNTLAKKRVKVSDLVSKSMKDWEKEAGITIGSVNSKGAIYLEGTAKVSVNAGRAEFVQARSAAFEQAYLDALTKYVMDKSGATGFALASTYFNDASSDRTEPNLSLEDAAQRIARKTEMLEEAKLDAALREAGVAVAEIENKTIVEKRQIFLERVFSEAVDKAIDSSSGVAVVKTFEGNDEKGAYAVGVILRGGTDTEVIADSLRSKKRPMIKRPDMADSVANLLPPREEILQEFGVRIIFDENGVPALLSFGQYGNDYTGEDEEVEDDMERLAMEQARGQANDLLTMFINSKINIVNRREKGSSRERNLEFDANGVPTENSIKKFISKVTKSANITGSDTMIGRSTVYEDVIEHKTGHRIAICVRMWSFNQFDAMKQIKDTPKKPEPPKKPVKPAQPAVKPSKTYDF